MNAHRRNETLYVQHCAVSWGRLVRKTDEVPAFVELPVTSVGEGGIKQAIGQIKLKLKYVVKQKGPKLK